MPDAATRARELAWLAEVAQKPFLGRCAAFLRRSGPAYLQSALTLGGGTASAAVVAGCSFGYQLLWVAPLGMLLGIVILAAQAHQTLSTGMRPLEAMRQYAGRGFAATWAFGALLASVIWHFPQYSLGSAVLQDAGKVIGWDLPRGPLGVAILVWSIVTAQLYGSKQRLMRVLDIGSTLLVWAIVACFLLVIAYTGIHDWGALWRGFFAFEVPPPRGEVSGFAVALSGIAAAVVVNMTFLYPHSLLTRGWGREHRQRARYDLVFGLCMPYVFAVSAIVLASANTVYASGAFAGKKLSPLEAAKALTAVLGDDLGRIVFDLGVLGMVLTTVTMHMVCSGFVCSEWFGWRIGSWKHRLAVLLPAPGVLGAVFWNDLSVWVAVPTSVIVGLMLPVTYYAIFKLQRSRAYLGDDVPRGTVGKLWLGAMGIAIAIVTAFFCYYLATDGLTFVRNLFA